jgi:transcriptional regulator with XRE-family HTH domain
MKRSKHQDVSTEHRPAGAVPDAKQLRKMAGDWLKRRRADAELSQADLAARLGLKYYTFISQIMGAWAKELGIEQAAFAKHLLMYYEPELHRLLFGAESK